MSDFAEEFDIGGKGAEQSAPDSLARLIEMSKELLHMEELVERSEEELKVMKSSLQLLRTGRIPDLMNEIGISSITVEGKVVEVSDFVSGSLPKDPEKRARAVAWLDSVGAGGLLKTEVTVEFGRNQHNEALSLAGELREKGHAMDVSSNVAPQTLLKFARDRLKAGEPIDFETLGLYTGKIAKVKGSSR